MSTRFNKTFLEILPLLIKGEPVGRRRAGYGIVRKAGSAMCEGAVFFRWDGGMTYGEVALSILDYQATDWGPMIRRYKTHEVLALMDEKGEDAGKFRREDWIDKWFICFEDGDVYYRNGDKGARDHWGGYAPNLMADDWVQVK